MKVLYSVLQSAIASGNETNRREFWAVCYRESSVKLASMLRSKYRQVSKDTSFDIVQDAFVKLMVKDLTYFEKYFIEENKMEGLLWRTIQNGYINRSKKTNPEPLEDDGHITIQPVYQPPYNGDIARLLKQIDKKQAKAFILHVFGGYKQEEIAEIEGVTLSAIKMRITRAKESLKTALIADS